jgi:hypothetical protein
VEIRRGFSAAVLKNIAQGINGQLKSPIIDKPVIP